MERTIEGLALEELEAHAHADLLLDRVEMRRCRNRRTTRPRAGNVTCTATNVAGRDVFALNDFFCTRIVA